MVRQCWNMLRQVESADSTYVEFGENVEKR